MYRNFTSGLFLLLAFFFLGTYSANTIQCPDYFRPLNNKKCVRHVPELARYNEAAYACRGYGGSLVSIQNAIDNSGIVSLISMSDEPVWLGIQCYQSNCTWDDGTGNAIYRNFATNNPNDEIGNRVVMSNTGMTRGKWYSEKNDNVLHYYVCETDPVPPILTDCLIPFGDYCYFPMYTELSMNDARSACLGECSELVSIHSPDENAFIRSFFNNISSNYIRIGGIIDNTGNSYTWLDNSPWDFQNFGYKDQSFGNCTIMYNRDDFVQAGQWINSNCEMKTPFMCKRRNNIHCGHPTTPTPTPPVVPNQCYGTHVLNGNGTLYSPNWPSSYLNVGNVSSCSFGLNTPIGTVTQIQFPAMKLDPASSISLYNTIFNEEPFLILSKHNIGNPQWFSSNTNSMKVVFRPCSYNCEQYTEVYTWMANFRPGAPIGSPSNLEKTLNHTKTAL